ncbi:MAG: HEAT repeat domain-containing protein [Planctomycetota bacterium]|nr:HEAT repeat domain-containing protein [Planctomycetota bacterium]
MFRADGHPTRSSARRSLRRGLSACALLALCLLVAAPARADDEKARKGFDFGGQDTKPTKKDGTPAKERKGGTTAPASDDPIQQNIAKLRTWPDRKATRAAESLFLSGKESLPYLVRTLKQGDPAVQAGAAWVLGKVGESVHVQVILGAAARRMNASRAEVFFNAAYGLDPKETKDWLISFLTLSSKPVFRQKAADFLAGKVGAEDRHRILQLLDSEKAAVRIAGLTLLGPAAVEDVDERLVQGLSDLSPSVAYAAARLLAKRSNAQLVARLNAYAREAGARERAYAIIALVETARANVSNPFEETTVVEMAGRRGLLHPEKLSRGAASVGLAYGALESRDTSISNLLDGRVMDTLISTLGGSHFRDYGSVSPSVFAALRRLSGRDLPDTAVAWAQWWQGNRASFRARRPLQKLEATDVAQAYVRFEAIAANGRRRTATFISEGGVERAGAFLLHRRVFEGLVAFLEGEGLFRVVERGGERANQHVSVTLGVLNQRKRMSVNAEVLGLGEADQQANRQQYERIRMRMNALIDANLWQRYRDTDKWPDMQSYWKANVELMAQAEPDERGAMLRAAIVHAFDDLPHDAARAEALVLLEEDGGRLLESEASHLARELTKRESFGRMEADGLKWVIQQGHDAVREEIVAAVSVRREPEARRILAGLLLDGGVERIRKAFADERPSMRAAGAHATRLLVESGQLKDRKPEERAAVYDRLRPGLEVLSLDQDEPAVSIRALIALAYIGEPGIVERLEQLYHGGTFNVKLEVTQSLGYIRGDSEAHRFLTRVMAEERKDSRSGALRAAALESMARSRHQDAVRLLRYYLLNDRDETVRDAAGRTLAELGSEEARFALVEHLTGGEPDPERRARIIDVLGRFEGEIVPPLLRRHLGDRDTRVRYAAALRAAQHNMSEAFPFLLDILRKGGGQQRDDAVQAIENLTSTRFAVRGYTALAERYEAWFEDPRVKGRDDRAWFREALKRKGYDISPMAVYLDGKQDLGPVPLLIRVLRDDDPILRRNAGLALERLTGRRAGDRIRRDTPAAEAAAAADRWSRWYAARSAAQPGR